MKHIFFRALVYVFFLNAITMFAAFPPPENGLKDLADWLEIPVKIVTILPAGALNEEYDHTDGTCSILKYTQNLFYEIGLQELRVGQSTLWASAVQHPFCLSCESYCVNGKCGYTLKPSSNYFKQGLSTVHEYVESDDRPNRAHENSEDEPCQLVPWRDLD